MVVRRFGRAGLVAFWLATGTGLGAIGTLRNLATQRSLGLDQARVNIPGLSALLIMALLAILSVPTIALARQASHATTPPNPLSRRFFAGVGWTAGGLLVTVALAIALDLANIPFIPIR